jgi:hypothetical protein
MWRSAATVGALLLAAAWQLSAPAQRPLPWATNQQQPHFSASSSSSSSTEPKWGTRLLFGSCHKLSCGEESAAAALPSWGADPDDLGVAGGCVAAEHAGALLRRRRPPPTSHGWRPVLGYRCYLAGHSGACARCPGLGVGWRCRLRRRAAEPADGVATGRALEGGELAAQSFRGRVAGSHRRPPWATEGAAALPPGKAHAFGTPPATSTPLHSSCTILSSSPRVRRRQRCATLSGGWRCSAWHGSCASVWVRRCLGCSMTTTTVSQAADIV